MAFKFGNGQVEFSSASGLEISIFPGEPILQGPYVPSHVASRHRSGSCSIEGARQEAVRLNSNQQNNEGKRKYHCRNSHYLPAANGA